MRFDGELIVRKSDGMDDWWCIEKKEHAGVGGLRPSVHGGFEFFSSSRVSDADVEGCGAEMRAIAEAILRGESMSFRRCSATVCVDGYALESPRNSMEPGIVPRERAEELARLILATIPAAEVQNA